MPKLVACKSSPPLGALISAQAVASKVKVEVTWGTDTSLTLDTGTVGATASPGISRCLARLVPYLYGSSILEQTEVDHWLTFCLGPLSCSAGELTDAITFLDTILKPVSTLVGDTVTVADYEVFGSLASSPSWLWLQEKGTVPASLGRWYSMMSARPEVKAALASLPTEARAKAAPPQDLSKEKKEESQGGKFVDLPGAVMGGVVVRFPPEASGYLHIGHAKAALLNNYYKESFQGKLIMRFDDTNPAKEKEEYEEVILEDLKLLEVRYDMFTRTSDHFETILKYCEKLMKEGNAYVDDTDAETMKIERDAKTESKNRNNSAKKNLEMWEEMKKGSEMGTKCAVRAKMDMKSLNGCMRDPTIYRCKPEPHPSTGTKYKVYPTYDFACPIVDSVEGVTHALRTTEYLDRDDQFNWFIDALGLRKPNIWAYARLNLTNTVMSKRKLTWLVSTGAVDGWDDPRLPTVRGVMRRGLTVEALKQFIIGQGSSRSVVFMEWDKIWAFNKKVLDPVVPRHTTVDKVYRVSVQVSGATVGSHMAAKHPKNSEVGEKSVWTGPNLLIDGADAELLKVGENATFINWGNLLIKKVNKGADGKVSSVEAEQNLENKDYKKTLKLTWLCDEKEKSPITPTILIYYDHIISKPILDKDDDFKNFIGSKTKHEFEMLGDPELKSLKKGEVVQVQRRGFFICDVPYAPYSTALGRPRPCVLLSIPDGTPTSYGPPGQTTKQAPLQSKASKEKGGQKKAGKGVFGIT
jgi:bifunctional glutamyl/prolyl-tRNA synthetase